jgi:predicted amidohydrolase YtcJ
MGAGVKHLVAIGLLAAAQALSAETIVLSNATGIDGTGQSARRNVIIVVNGSPITDILVSSARTTPTGVMTLDLTDKFVIPGLIDSHVHLATDPATTDPRDQVQRRLAQALYGGVTSVRDMAGDLRMLADLQRAATSGDIESPSTYYSAPWAGPAFFSDRRGSAFAEMAEHEKGTLAPGMLADLAVLSQDIFTVPAPALPSTHSMRTILGGRIAWDELNKGIPPPRSRGDGL